MKEIKEARQSTTLAEMAAPLQVSVTAATGKFIQQIGEKILGTNKSIWVVHRTVIDCVRIIVKLGINIFFCF